MHTNLERESYSKVPDNKKEPDRITGITVRGFKSLADETRIDIKPLTILAGANSSGKSSIMQPLLLMKQTLEAPSDPGALLLDGEHVQFSSADQLLCIAPKGAERGSFSIQVESGAESSFAITFLRDPEHGYDVGAMHYRFPTMEFTLKRGMHQEDVKKILPNFTSLLSAIALEYPKSKWEVLRDRCFLKVEFTGGEKQFRFAPMLTSDPLAIRLESIIHLPGLRGNPKRTYPKTAVGQSFQGTFEPYVASLIHGWQNSGGSDQLSTLGRALEDLGLTWKVEAQRVDDTQIGLRVGRLAHARGGGARDMVNIADVGLGVSQVLPVVVALIQAKPGQLVYLEQPEIHLHPLAQRKLAKLLAHAAKRGVVLVVETHSNLLLREVQTLVAKGELTPDEVAMHWFERDKNGCTKVSTAELDENGAYGMDWPADFDRVESDSEGAYLDAVEFRQEWR